MVAPIERQIGANQSRALIKSFNARFTAAADRDIAEQPGDTSPPPPTPQPVLPSPIVPQARGDANPAAGIGNGDFKPIEQTFQDQNQAIKDAGCATYGFAPKKQCSNERVQRALRTGSDYGQINPIASASLEVFDGLNMITEWSGRNLNAGLSWRPFADLGIVITPMVESIVRNCEYQECRVTPIKGYSKKVALDDNILTSRLRLSIQASIQIKF